MSGLTTHVLDTMHGKPAAGVRLRLTRGGAVLAEGRTNHGGRWDGPLLTGAELTAGRYELAFEVGDYFRGLGILLPHPAFLETVTLAFGVADVGSHYHVPLLVSPWAYSTYRGS